MHINYLTFITLPCELLLSEEGFGFLKSSFYVPDAELIWSFETQVDVARYVIHNHIIRIDSNESIMKDVTRDIKLCDSPTSNLSNG